MRPWDALHIVDPRRTPSNTLEPKAAAHHGTTAWSGRRTTRARIPRVHGTPRPEQRGWPLELPCRAPRRRLAGDCRRAPSFLPLRRATPRGGADNSAGGHPCIDPPVHPIGLSWVPSPFSPPMTSPETYECLLDCPSPHGKLTLSLAKALPSVRFSVVLYRARLRARSPALPLTPPPRMPLTPVISAGSARQKARRRRGRSTRREFHPRRRRPSRGARRGPTRDSQPRPRRPPRSPARAGRAS